MALSPRTRLTLRRCLADQRVVAGGLLIILITLLALFARGSPPMTRRNRIFWPHCFRQHG